MWKWFVWSNVNNTADGLPVEHHLPGLQHSTPVKCNCNAETQTSFLPLLFNSTSFLIPPGLCCTTRPNTCCRNSDAVFHVTLCLLDLSASDKQSSPHFI